MSYDNYAKNAIVINEVSSNNFLCFSDEDEYAGDYVEIYNPSYTAVSLDGYILSDEEYICDLSGYIIKPYEYIVLSTTSADKKLTFSINADGEKLVLANNGKEIDSVEIPEMERDVFYMREEDGSGNWVKVTEATPNQANINAINNKVPTLNEPVFSLESGFYDENIEVKISSEYKNCKIYYTLDGTEPTIDSFVYDEPIKLSDYSIQPNKYSAIENTAAIGPYIPTYLIDKANVIKAIVVNEDGEKSAVAAKTYFINFNEKSGYDNVMIMSLIIDEDDFFSDEKGIYVLGDRFAEWIKTQDSDFELSEVPFYLIEANYFIEGKKSERNVKIELFDENRNLKESEDAVVKILGAANRARINKTLGINTFDERSVFYNNKYALRARDVIFSESITQKLVLDRNVGIQEDMGVCALFINGEYWGTYMIQERSKERYFTDKFNIPEANLVVIKNDEVDIGNEGDIQIYKELQNLCSQDCTIKDNYDKVCEIIDKQSLIDYFCFNLYIGNTDWPYNNYSCWRSKKIVNESEYQDGKWRWNVFDVDWGGVDPYRNSFSKKENLNKKKPLEHPIIRELIKNEEFKKEFVNTFLDLANYNFSSDIVSSKIEDMKGLYLSSVVNNSKRFIDEKYGVAEAEKEISILNDFYNKRFEIIVPIMAKELELQGTLEEITLEVNDIDGGSISINTITPQLNDECKWIGYYYTDYTVLVTAKPKEGYRFIGWEGTYENHNQTLEVDILPGGVTVKAIFEKIN